jgi:hypothetical protein
VAAHYWQDAEGEGTAWEAVAVLGPKGCEATTAAETVRLWRGAKGQERISREKENSRDPHDAKTSEISPKGKDQRGYGEPMTPIAL